MNNEISINKIIGDIKKTNGNRKYCYNLPDHLSDYAGSIVGWLKATTPNRIDTLVNFAVDRDAELTAALATIEKCREITGCPPGVDLQDHLRQLVAERDAALNAERAWETAMMEVCGEDGPASVASEIRSLQALRDTAMQALKSQVEQLAAENVGLKVVFSQEEIPSEAVDAFMETAVMDHDWNETSEWSWVENETEVIHAVLDALKPETPATDRIVAGIKADGVDSGIETIMTMLNHQAPGVSDAINVLRVHSSELREGAK